MIVLVQQERRKGVDWGQSRKDCVVLQNARIEESHP